MIDKSIKGLDLGGYKPKVEVPNLINDLTDGNRVATNESNIQGLQGQVNTHNGEISNLSNEVANKASVQYVDQKFNGASKAIAYDSYLTMITAFNALADDIYAIGQDVLIETLQVPDLWVSGIESASVPYTYVDDETFTSELDTNGYVQVGYYKLSALETQKVNLTDYQEKLTAGTNITIDANNVINSSVDTSNLATLDTLTQSLDGSKTFYNKSSNSYITLNSGTQSSSPNYNNSIRIGLGSYSSSASLTISQSPYSSRKNFNIDSDNTSVILTADGKKYRLIGGSGTSTIATLDDILDKVPNAPTTDATYVLKVVVSNGTPTYQWVLES